MTVCLGTREPVFFFLFSLFYHPHSLSLLLAPFLSHLPPLISSVATSMRSQPAKGHTRKGSTAPPEGGSEGGLTDWPFQTVCSV